MPKYKINISFLYFRNTNRTNCKNRTNYILPQIAIIYFRIHLYYNYIKCSAIGQAIEIRGKPLAKAPNHQLAVFPTICWLCTDFLTRPSACLPACLPAYLSVPTCLCLPVYAYCLCLPSVPTCLCYLYMPTVCAYHLCLQSVPTICAYHLCLPSVPTICAYHLCLPSLPVCATVYAYLSVIWGRSRPDRRLCLIRLID